MAAARLGSQGVATGSPGEPGQPRRGMRSRRRYRRGLISVPVVPPRLPVRLSQAYSPANRAGDPDAAPVEIAVVAELRAARRQQVKQPPYGGGWLAADADQRRAATAELVRGGRDHHGILADPHGSRGQCFIVAAQLPEGEHHRLPCFPLQRQDLAQSGASVAGQTETEHQRGEFVKVNAHGGPHRAAGVRARVGRERQVCQRADRGQGERPCRAPVIEGVRVAAALGGEPPDRNVPRRQSSQHRRHLVKQHQCHIRRGGQAAHDTGRVEPTPPGGQFGSARYGVVQRRERGRPGACRIQPVAVAVPERTGQQRDGLGQPAGRSPALAQNPVHLGQRH